MSNREICGAKRNRVMAAMLAHVEGEIERLVGEGCDASEASQLVHASAMFAFLRGALEEAECPVEDLLAEVRDAYQSLIDNDSSRRFTATGGDA